ncbi:MAG: M57 family metalloprotease [bacterium]|nr:M57 family metalloprotease [bacterium]
MSWRIVFNATIILVVFLAIFIVWNYPRFTKIPLACEEPIAYTIGTFDRRFGISYKTFLSALAQAEAIWEKPIGKELFVYSPEESELSINLIYDSRQEVTSTLSNLGSTLKEDETTYKILQTKYVKLKTEYKSAKNAYDAQISAFDERNSLYQSHVEAWNSGKRNSREQFKELEKEKMALEIEIKELKVLESGLNEMVRNINALVGMLNRMAKSLNLSVKKYNTIGASRGETFTGGVYSQMEGERSIDVYEFSSRDKLVRVLTHELGHALGLEHIDDEKAMMYHLNESKAKVLSEADLVALRKLCGIE